MSIDKGRIEILTLAYHNTAHTDGLGSQLQRLFGAYCVSRLVSTAFLNLGLFRIDYQGLGAIERNEADNRLVSEVNGSIFIPSAALEISRFGGRIYSLENPSLEEVQGLKSYSEAELKQTLLLLTYPFAILDQNPSGYRYASGLLDDGVVSRYKLLNTSASSELKIPTRGVLDVSVHVRRGELLVLDSHRMLSDDFYLSVLVGLIKILKDLGVKYRIRVHSETTSGNLDVLGESPGILNRIPVKKTVNFGADRFAPYLALENVELCLNEAPLAALLNMANADVLVGSKSSLSYVAAFAGRNTLSFFPAFWHALLPHWILCDGITGQFDHRAVLSRLTADCAGALD